MGDAFAIAAVVYEERESKIYEINRFVGRCPIDKETDKWVMENVLPKITDIRENYTNYDLLLKGFSEFYMNNKTDSDIIVHMGVPVEARLFIDAHNKGFIGDWDAPYPLIDISGCLKQAKEDPTSTDAYVIKYGLEITEGNTHNPIYDSEVATKVYYNLLNK